MATDRTGLQVLVLAPYPMGLAPNQRFRFEQYLVRLREDDIRMDVSSFLPRGIMPVIHTPGRQLAKGAAVVRGMGRRISDLLAARRYDAVLVSREATPLGYPWVERLLAALKIPYVLDFDDAIYLSNASAANRRLAALKFPGKTATIARHAALVIAGNEHLAEWAERQGARVTVIPTTIDTDSYRPRPRGQGREERLCIGWSGSVTTSAYLNQLAPLLGELQSERQVRLRVIGDPGYRVAGADVEALPWRADTELADLQEIDIGVMPLPDDEWARGKCGLKALQYMALGIPTVMSPVGVNSAIAAGGAAMLADSPAQWRDTLTRLLDDPGLRERLGHLGRERVERDYSVDSVAPRWAEALWAASRHGVIGHG